MATKRMNIVGERVKQARLKHKPRFTQDELSAQLSRLGVYVDRAGIAKIETGIRCVVDYELKALTKVLGVSVDWLLGSKGSDRREWLRFTEPRLPTFSLTRPTRFSRRASALLPTQRIAEAADQSMGKGDSSSKGCVCRTHKSFSTLEEVVTALRVSNSPAAEAA